MPKYLSIYLIILTLLFSGCVSEDREKISKTVFRYNESKGITSLDPAFARNQTNIWPVTQIFNGLVQLDEEMQVKACIARTWEISEDGKIYTFYLRPDVKYHSTSLLPADRRVRADDFVFSFNRIMDTDLASPGSWIFEYVNQGAPFIAVNDTVLKIILEKPFPPFLSILAMPYCSVVPPELINDPEYDFPSAPVGTGPFQFKFWSPEEKLILLKNPEYFESDSLGQPLPYLDAVNVSFIKDKQSEFLEFLKGNLDFLSGVHPAYKDELLTRSGSLNPAYSDRFKLATQAYLNTEYLGILIENREDNEHPLLDKNVRQAINYGFDRHKMMKYMRNNLGYPATAGMIPPGLPGHMEENSAYTYNPDRARELLSLSGYNAENPVPAIELTTTADYLDLCEFIQFELSKIGLELEIQVSTGGAFRNQVANGNLPFFRGSWIADYADAENYLALFYSLNHAPDGPNYTRFSSDEFDMLYRKIINTAEEEIRFKLYRRMDSIVMSEAPIVPLYYDKVVRFMPLNLEGFQPNPMNNLILKTVRKPLPNNEK